jgi:hypothetical protein
VGTSLTASRATIIFARAIREPGEKVYPAAFYDGVLADPCECKQSDLARFECDVMSVPKRRIP